MKYDEIDQAERSAIQVGECLDYANSTSLSVDEDKRWYAEAGEAARGLCVPMDGVIQCSADREEKTKQVLLHELQHVIRATKDLWLGTIHRPPRHTSKRREIYEQSREYLQEAVDR